MLKPNILVLGASGNVSHSVLFHLKKVRPFFADFFLVDKREFIEDKYINLSDLDCKFINLEVNQNTSDKFLEILRENKIELVVDLSNAPTELVSEIVFNYGKASYICCSFCSTNNLSLAENLNKINTRKRDITLKMPHIFFTGMNPGIVNILVEMGIRKYGIPDQIIEMEFDTSQFLNSQNKKIVTWCIEEFIHELMIDPTEIMLGRDKYISLHPNALFHCENMEKLLSPIWKYDSYPNGCILSHEECVTLSQRYDIPFKFIYSVHSSTMNYLKTMEQSEVKVVIDNLLLGDNFNNPLDGSDSIAVRLEYEDKNIYYTNSLKNQDIIGGSATAYQVTVGVYAAIFSLIFDEYQPGIYYPEELAETLYPSYVCANLEINECVMNMNTKKQKWSNIKCKNRKKSNVEINIV